MFTYFLYNFILVVCSFFAYYAEHDKMRFIRVASRVIVFLALFLPAALRYETGTDYGSYVDIFYKTTPGSQEYSWYLLNSFIRNLGLSVQWVFVFSSFLIYFPICFFTKRTNFFYLIFLYIILFFYFKSFNTIRQCIAVSFIISSISFYEKKNLLLSILFALLAYSFHVSAALFLGTLLFGFIKYKSEKIPLVLCCIGIAFLISFNVLQLALSLLSSFGFKYAVYLNKPEFLEKMALGSGLGVLVSLLPSFYFIFKTKQINKQYGNKSLYVTLSIVYILSYFVAVQFVIMGRVRDIFTFVPVLTGGYAFGAKGKYRKLIVIVICFLLILVFEKNIYMQTRDAFSNSIYPYYSIFSKY